MHDVTYTSLYACAVIGIARREYRDRFTIIVIIITIMTILLFIPGKRYEVPQNNLQVT